MINATPPLKSIGIDSLELIEEKNRQLFDAIERGNLDEVKLAIAQGANVNAKIEQKPGPYEFFFYPRFWTPLHKAISMNWLDAVDLLMEAGADPNIAAGPEMVPALHHAVYNRWENAVNALVAHENVEINCLDEEGNNALHFAVGRQNFSMFRVLIKSGIDVDAVNHKQQTPLEVAMILKDEQAMRTLIDLGVDIQTHSSKRWSPLLSATKEKWKEGCKLLLGKGANGDHVDKDGIRPALLALTKGFEKMQSLFPPENYDHAFVDFKLFSHALNLKNNFKSDGKTVPCGGFPVVFNPQLFEHFADAVRNFLKLDPLKEREDVQEVGEEIQSALEATYNADSNEQLKNRIQAGQLTFLATGWEKHGVFLCFVDGLLAISNRGQRKDRETLSLFEIDPSLFTEEVLLTIRGNRSLSFEKGSDFLYKDLITRLNGKRVLHHSALLKLPKSQKGSNCGYKSPAGGLRFAWIHLLNKKGFEGDPIDVAKSFSTFADLESSHRPFQPKKAKVKASFTKRQWDAIEEGIERKEKRLSDLLSKLV